MSEIVYETSNQVAVIRINRPEASNAVNSQVMAELPEALERAANDASVRAVLITGTGDRSFVAGGDLKEFHDTLHSAEDVYKKWSVMRQILYRIATFNKPVVAGLNGAVRGGGAELAMACHFRVASSKASIGFVQVKLGISPGWGGAALLARTVGMQRARWLLLSGQVLEAAEAEGLGLVDRVVSSLTFMPDALQFAGELAANPPDAVQGILEMMRTAEKLDLAASMELESRLCASLWNSEPHQAAIDRFLKKRK
ncbi:enoyl-CoA hydratase/isomerase family protein [Effusibacillus dendaii]|uniref:Ethylmalonyl-CoA decarboxylase n=1 Tax=Effusibacillus dendaii TaxID=2743772 RepID=A0A7I8DGG1_9BACL|nr:enoyl-CoA hydratase/isomerase family protein [Effusibacillus dendaii]BCJ88069.1 enoyl-CoA hydratase [Effusibacillus dendaii]